MDIRILLVCMFCMALPFMSYSRADGTAMEAGLKGSKVGSATDSGAVLQDQERISVDGFSIAEQKLIEESAQKLTFNAEVNKLMHIIINSLYTKSEVFLRELISNGSDALDKIRFISLTNPDALGKGDIANLDIRLKGDEAANTLTITDKGVGMTKEELIKNLGTIAQSGTKDFLQKFQQYSDSNLIGQFGVGFYSVFLVADSVTVISKSNDDPKQHIWQSSADGTFSVTEDPRGNTLGRGTQLIIHLKEDAKEYANQESLKQLVIKYSEFINFPIYIWSSKEVSSEVPLSEEEIAAKKAEKAAEASEGEEDTEDSDVATTKTVVETVRQWEQVNTVKPLWMRPISEISDDDYKEFYKASTKDYTDPLKWAHFNAEGEVEFKSLLYIPSTAPQGLYDGSAKTSNMKLFVRRVFISDDFSEILPKYLSFLRGLVDSDDLPLNVSREQLQQHKTLSIIKKKLVRKAIAMLQEMKDSDDKETWNKFYQNFGTSLKLGVIEDPSNRTRLSKLLQFLSSKSGEMTTLEEYVSRMKKGQDSIYYLGGESREAIEQSPLLERLKKRGFEVLYMTEPIDEYAMQNLNKFDGKYNLVNAGREGLKLPGEKENVEADKEEKAKFDHLLTWMKAKLNDQVAKVVLSKRLSQSPSAIVTASFGYTANMERIMKAQAMADPNSKNNFMFNSKKTMEINPRHPLVKQLLKLVTADESDPVATEITEVLYETAKLTSGFSIDQPSEFANRINKLLSRSAGVENEVVDEEVIEEVEVDETQSGDDELSHEEL